MLEVEARRLAGRRVLVTGAGGFIGSHLVEALAALGSTVRALVRYDSRGTRGWLDELAAGGSGVVEFVAGDIQDPRIVDEAVDGCEIVLHLAALIGIPYSYRAPGSYIAVNTVGTLNVLDACRRHAVARLVHTSTSEVYGTAQRVPIDESHPLRPQSPYAASKSAADQLALAYHASFGTPVVVLRPFNTFGPRQSLRAIVPTIAAQLLHTGRVHIGSTHPTRDLTYVSDTVVGFLAAASVPGIEGRTIQLGTGLEISIGDLARRIAGIVGVELQLERDPERVRPSASEVERLVSDHRLATELLGWAPSIGLDEGLRRTIDWMRQRPLADRARGYQV